MLKFTAPSMPNIPWEDRPEGCTDVVWRSTNNPIIDNKKVHFAQRIYNSGVVPFKDGFAGVFRVDDAAKCPYIRVGFSKDGLNWDIADKPIDFKCDDPEVKADRYGYDPRVVFIEDRYYVTWCNSTLHGATVGIAYTFDFETFHQMENAFLPQNRNGVLFPRKINGNYMMISRPCDKGHNPFGDMFISESPDLEYWGRHRHLMGPAPGWQGGKIGAGPIPIETEEGWLIIYHGTVISCNGYIYSFGAALLDLENPSKVLYRSHPFLLAPEELYERVGEVPNVVFPCAALCDKDTGRMAIYYGAADTCMCVAYANIEEVVKFVKENSI